MDRTPALGFRQFKLVQLTHLALRAQRLTIVHRCLESSACQLLLAKTIAGRQEMLTEIARLEFFRERHLAVCGPLLGSNR